MPTFGWKAGAEQFPPGELLQAAVAAEQAGFELIDVSDHFHPWDPRGQAPFAWTWLGAAAALTSTIRLGPGLTCPILRYHPAIIAQAAATLAALAPGRTYLAVGTGEALNEVPVVAGWPPYDVRQDMLAEAIELIRDLWTGEEVSFDGDFYQTQKARLHTLPDEEIPIYVSSLVPDSATFAGRYGDGLLTVGGKEPEKYRKIILAFAEGARAAGKDPAELPKMVEVPVEFTGDISGVLAARKKYWAATFIPALFNRKIYTPAEAAENGAVIGSDMIRDAVLLSTDPEDHVRHARQYLDLGFDTLIFHAADPEQERFIETYGREVLPRLRAAAR